MQKLNTLKNFILSGGSIDRDDAAELYSAPLTELCTAADAIRRHFCGSSFDICTIVNAKCGRCSEDCKYCAQSAHYNTQVEEHPLLDTSELVRQARYNAQRGVLRYSLVTSGRSLCDIEVAHICDSIRAIHAAADIKVCISLGLLNKAQFSMLKAAGASRVHCNLETSRGFFPSVCTTHTYDEKIAALKAARSAGLGICSGGIIGLGEAMADRIDMAFTLRELGVKSVPVNFLSPIPGTPFEHNTPLSDDEKLRTIAVFRFILPDASIRLAGGRGLMADKGESCFCSGANAAISGDMLTTAGITIEADMALLQKLGYKAELCDE